MPDSLPATGGAILRAVEELRSDVREDFRALDDKIDDFITIHGKIHEVEATERINAHARFEAFIQTQEIMRARREGALGVLRFGLLLFARYDRQLIGLILATALAILAASGNLHLTIGGP